MENLTKSQFLSVIRSMGYRKMGNHKGETVYGKPVSSNLFTISFNELLGKVRFINHFTSYQSGSPLVWNSNECVPVSEEKYSAQQIFLSWLKSQEGYTKLFPECNSSFHFISQEELADSILED